MTFRVKTPRETVSAKTLKVAADLFFQSCERTTYKAAIDKLADTARALENRQYVILATFFQRVCARTPLDEKYINGIDSKGNLIYHRPNKVRCRFDWYISCGEKVVSAEEMVNQIPTIFNFYNNKGAIKEVETILRKAFKGLDISECIIGNENPYFATLEYGGYDHDTAPRKGIVEEPWESGEKHGVKNKHSIQAPVGMLRVTQMELQSIIQESANNTSTKGNAAYRFKNSSSQKNLSKSELDGLISKFKAHSHLSLKDIKRYIDL